MTKSSSPTFYEFFAGGGMARLGLGTKWSCVFANDFDPVKASAYRANFADADKHFHEGDVWKIGADRLPGTADLAWASSPCQDFSLAGNRAGLKGGRSSAFFGFWRLIKSLNAEGRAPRTVVVENVVGLLTSHGGKDFEALCQAFFDEGYRVGAFEIDAARFVPQSRPRVFVVATRENVPASLARIEPKAPFHSRRVIQAKLALPKYLQERWVWWDMNYPPPGNQSVESIIEPDESVRWFSEEKSKSILNLFNEKNSEKIDIAISRGGRAVGTIFRRMRVEGGKKIQRAEIRFDGVAGCLRTPRGGSSQQFVAVVEGGGVKIRALTPREAARLMGLGEHYLLPATRTAALSITGDGVVVDVVQFLAENVLDKLINLKGDGVDEPADRGDLALAR
ncbi:MULTISPECIES: DNA cytosine methyltransferase [unclassified Caulobacter]|uniref:DNA cytosine methyltransferase n=1 Tax=unclassified Caulobacter TaxID=2648921 RepID=UPI0007802C73|nr:MULTISPECIES: DNA cytosine methyltransferase [unclassified Caulobacter]AZS23577.1 DNA cytosine methyltransferase [Caulobacter sp. FWC26]